MRRARLTYPGAYHHVMNRGIAGERIFPDDGDKKFFLKLLDKKSRLQRIRVFGYCILGNHFHLILENSSGRMSHLIKQVCGAYGIHYRQKHGGKGYVFQSRFKSTLIQYDSYLRLAIIYLLQNPVRAGLVGSADEYRWSSAGEYLGHIPSSMVDASFVLDLWGGRRALEADLRGAILEKLPILKSDFGDLLGEKKFMGKALKLQNRRVAEGHVERRRRDDNYFEPVGKVYRELEKEYRVKLAETDFTCRSGKRVRGELLVRLKEMAGLTYREIAQLPEFGALRLFSLGKLYRDVQMRKRMDDQNKVKK